MILLTDLVRVSTRTGSTTGKKEKIHILANFLKQVRGEEIRLAAAYLSGQVPQGRLGIGWATLQAVLKDIAYNPQAPALVEVDRVLEGVSKEKGAGSAERKGRLLKDLFSRAPEEERDFLVRLIMGEIRQGALEGLLVEAVAEASSVPPERVRQALMFSGVVGEVARAALEEGTSGLAHFRPRLLEPVAPMLANPAEGEAEALARLGEAAWEYKIDGARIQVHKDGEAIRIFTRSLRDVTRSVPDLVRLARSFPFEKGIIEGEAVALRPDGRPHPFQITMRRFGRIRQLDRMVREIPLAAFFFDLLYVNGQSLFDMPYRDRFDILARSSSPEYVIPRIVTGEEKAIHDFLQKSLEAGHEGLMAKALDSPYIAGQRGYQWLKIKKAQTLDLVILAAEWGHGRRRGWLSNLHLAARDPESGQWVMLGKTFKGLTDQMLRWQTEKLLQLETGRDDWTVYVRPELVVEVAFSDLQESPRYPGGLALRFARVKRYREDKSSREADTIQKVWTLFEFQRRQNSGQR